jgi:hypothetical protein
VKKANAYLVGNDVFFSFADNLKNPKKLSVADVRATCNFNDLSEEEILELINQLYKFSVLTFKIYKDETNK